MFGSEQMQEKECIQIKFYFGMKVTISKKHLWTGEQVFIPPPEIYSKAFERTRRSKFQRPRILQNTSRTRTDPYFFFSFKSDFSGRIFIATDILCIVLAIAADRTSNDKTIKR